MDISVQYWHWLVLGMALILAEIFMPSFTVFWFGLGAVVASALPGALSAQATRLVLNPTVADRTPLPANVVVSDDGSKVAFISDASGLVPGFINNPDRAFVYDVATERVGHHSRKGGLP